MDNNLNQNMTEITSNSKQNFNKLFGSVYSKFNKPFIVSKLDLFNHNEIKSKYSAVIDIKTNQTIKFNVDEEDNYFCVDKYTNMVLESNLTLLVIFQIKLL